MVEGRLVGVRPGEALVARGVICSTCFAPLPEWSPDPSWRRVFAADGSLLGVTRFETAGGVGGIRCAACQGRGCSTDA